MGFWPVVLNVLRNSDVVLLLVDARMPEITRNSEIIQKVKEMGRQLIIVFNKTDLIGQKDIKKLNQEYPKAFFISSTKKTGVKELKKYLEKRAEDWKKSSLRVGLVGYPNIGKSTLMNILLPKARAKVSSVSGTTKKTQWVREGRLRIMDSPGVIPFGDKKVQIGMTASKDPHKIKNPENVAMRIIEYLERRDDHIIRKFYKAIGKNPQEIFEAIAKKKGYLVKGGKIDENRTAIRIIDDWQKGRIKFK